MARLDFSPPTSPRRTEEPCVAMPRHRKQRRRGGARRSDPQHQAGRRREVASKPKVRSMIVSGSIPYQASRDQAPSWKRDSEARRRREEQRGQRPAARQKLRPSHEEEDGWQLVQRHRHCKPRRRQAPAPEPMKKPLPAAFKGRCLQCLAYDHVRADCHRQVRCLHCNGRWHEAKDCKRPRSPSDQGRQQDEGRCARVHDDRRRTSSKRPSLLAELAGNERRIMFTAGSLDTPPASDAGTRTPSPAREQEGEEHHEEAGPGQWPPLPTGEPTEP